MSNWILVPWGWNEKFANCYVLDLFKTYNFGFDDLYIGATWKI